MGKLKKYLLNFRIKKILHSLLIVNLPMLC
nr:MAG TPA: hypothetical protein [Caudoviricetes sp.]